MPPAPLPPAPCVESYRSLHLPLLTAPHLADMLADVAQTSLSCTLQLTLFLFYRIIPRSPLVGWVFILLQCLTALVAVMVIRRDFKDEREFWSFVGRRIRHPTRTTITTKFGHWDSRIIDRLSSSGPEGAWDDDIDICHMDIELAQAQEEPHPHLAAIGAGAEEAKAAGDRDRDRDAIPSRVLFEELGAAVANRE